MESKCNGCKRYKCMTDYVNKQNGKQTKTCVRCRKIRRIWNANNKDKIKLYMKKFNSKTKI